MENFKKINKENSARFCVSYFQSRLETCTREEQRSFIWFLRSEGVKPFEIHQRMTVQYRDTCLLQQQVYEWSRKFANGVISLGDVPRPKYLRTIDHRKFSSLFCW